jgi:hypothetical protein
MCQEVHDYIIASGGSASDRDLRRKLGRKDKFGNGLLGRAIEQLTLEGRIKKWMKGAKVGRPSDGWEIVSEDG